jgi:mevalonate pyrophosphate decarboxylase
MNTTSKNIANKIRDINQAASQTIAAYSCDAGFHVFVFVMEKDKDGIK